MKQRSHLLLLATLVSASAWGQEVTVNSTSMVQYWKEEVPGFDKKTFTPVTQYLDVDATKLGSDGLSMHLYGWGMADLSDSSLLSGKKSDGYLTYGYLDYRFAQANAEIKGGRFLVNQGVAIEQVDGISARTDLAGGFTISVFGGRPVRYRTANAAAQSDYEFQNDFIFGSRLSTRVLSFGEVGLSFLQDGTKPAKDLPIPSQIDYTRKQVGLDFRLSPVSSVDLSGRTVYDMASRPEAITNQDKTPSRVAEHDYTATVKLASNLSVSGNFTERNFQAYFAGTNLPSLFNQVERDAHRAYEGRVTWSPVTAFQVVTDYRHTHRDTYGDADRFGLEGRWTVSELKLQTGLGYHKVNADDARSTSAILPGPPLPGAQAATYGLTHAEVRGWVMYTGSLISGSLDGIFQNFKDSANPQLNGRGTIYQLVGSLGLQSTSNLKFSADVSYGSDPLYFKELRGLLRVEYRFGTAGKGGSK